MAWRVEETGLPGVKSIVPAVFADERGFFFESFHAERHAGFGVTGPFVQDNVSRSRRGTLRGLHYQIPRLQAKLVMVLHGTIFDVAVDIRRGSPTFGHWTSRVLSDVNHEQLYIPRGFAHGFYVLSDEADVSYKCDDVYVPADDSGILWSDPDLGIDWPAGERLLSPKDAKAPCLRDVPPARLPVYG